MPELSTDMSKVTRVTLSLTHFGAGVTKAALGAPVAAQLVFSGAFFSKARGVSKPPLEPFANYSGTIALEGPQREPVFRLDPAEEIQYLRADTREPEIVRDLQLAFDSAQFKPPLPDEHPASILFLPEEPEGARFMELGVELLVAGAVEAAMDANDRLDVPLTPIVQRLVLEWPDAYTPRVPEGLTLEATAGKVRRSKSWESGEVVGIMRRIVLERLPLEPVSLAVFAGGGRTQLWTEQDLTADQEPQWENWLEDVLQDVGPEDEEGDPIDQNAHQSQEADSARLLRRERV